MNIFIRKSEDRSKPNRRDFLLQTSCATLGITSMVNTLSQLKLVGSAAAQGAGDYKALVCLFLNGGADSNNLLMPAGTAGSAARANYETGRGVLAIPNAQYDFLPPANNGYFNGTAIVTDAVSSRITPINGTAGSTAYDPASRSTLG
jgi:hypothetical protein